MHDNCLWPLTKRMNSNRITKNNNDTSGNNKSHKLYVFDSFVQRYLKMTGSGPVFESGGFEK